jgi:CheY-like chemotaxis protein
MLKKLGLKPKLAEDGRQALEELAGSDYDLVLMDCQMPVMDGYEACREIRRGEKGGQIPVIALTANVSGSDRKKCRDAGMDDFLAKPFTMDEIAAVLERWLPPEKTA